MRRLIVVLATLLPFAGCVGHALPAHRPYARVPFSPDSQQQTRVLANAGWQDSGVRLEIGDRVFIDARGTWSGGLGWESGPSGAVGTDIGRILESEPAATALIGRIEAGPAFRIGDQLLIADVKEPGRLQMRMNDPSTWDNSGFLTATISVKSGKAGREPPKPEQRALAPRGDDEGASAASGFLLKNTSLVVTSYHAVKDRAAIKLTFPNGEEYQGRLVVRDRANDLALVEAQGLAPSPGGLVLAVAADLKVGETVHALGYPLGIGLSRKPSMVSGAVSATVGVEDDITRFRTTAPINPGNSGGPMVNAKGQVIGIAAAGLVRTEVEAVRFAVKASAASLLLRQAAVSSFDIRVVPADAPPRPPERIFEEMSPYVVLIETR